MKALHFDSVGGAAGDMILAALIDLGADKTAIEHALAGLHLGSFRIETQAHAEHGLHGTRVVVYEPSPHNAEHDHGHPHRGLTEIRKILAEAILPEETRRLAKAVFTRLAEAEACVHRTTPDAVHFHEVGALDAIADIVGACSALRLLGIERVSVGPLPLGHGVVHCAHGLLPVPAPGTVELLKGLPVRSADEPFELVTPTGAALLATWRAGEAPPSGARLVAVGHGFGHRTLKHRPNLLRALLLETAEEPGEGAECLVLETNVDDQTPELVGALMRRLFEIGVLDAFCAPVVMKKQRLATLITVLCRLEQREQVLDVLFAESTSFGVREYTVRRHMLARRETRVETPYGPVRVQIGAWKNRETTRSPEYEDCVRLAAERGVPARAVYEAAVAAARTQA